MNIVTARDILSGENKDNAERNPFLEGLKIIDGYCPQPVYRILMNYFFVLGFRDIVPKMSEEDVVCLAKMGWVHNNQFGESFRFEIREVV